MKHARTGHLLRWFLLLWLGLIYVWGLQLMGLLLIGAGGNMIGSQSIESFSLFPGVPSPYSSTEVFIHTPSSFCAPLSPSPFTVLLFSVLMICHVGLYWFGLSGKMPKHWRFPYLAAQGLLVGTISLFLFLGRCGAGIPAPPEDFLICLYLALIVGAISILDRAGAIIATVSGYILLLVVSTVLLVMNTMPQANRVVFVSSLQASAQSSIWYLAMILFVVGYTIVYLQQLRTHSQLQVTHARLKASAAKIEELTRAYERQRLARELHDTLAQGLAGVVMQLEAANTHLSHQRPATAQEIVQQAILSSREALVEARGAIDNLRAQPADTSDISLALQKECERFTAATGILCNTSIPHNLCTSPRVHEHILGIVREGFANITRHAQARHAWISLAPNGETLALEIGDDGVGFDPAAAPAVGHYGLIGVRERARLLGGSLTIRSAPGMGTRLQVHLPAEQCTRETPESGKMQGEHKMEGENLHA